MKLNNKYLLLLFLFLLLISLLSLLFFIQSNGNNYKLDITGLVVASSENVSVGVASPEDHVNSEDISQLTTTKRTNQKNDSAFFYKNIGSLSPNQEAEHILTLVVPGSSLAGEKTIVSQASVSGEELDQDQIVVQVAEQVSSSASGSSSGGGGGGGGSLAPINKIVSSSSQSFIDLSSPIAGDATDDKSSINKLDFYRIVLRHQGLNSFEYNQVEYYFNIQRTFVDYVILGIESVSPSSSSSSSSSSSFSEQSILFSLDNLIEVDIDQDGINDVALILEDIGTTESTFLIREFDQDFTEKSIENKKLDDTNDRSMVGGEDSKEVKVSSGKISFWYVVAICLAVPIFIYLFRHIKSKNIKNLVKKNKGSIKKK